MEIFEGKLSSPDSVIIPGVQEAKSIYDPIVYARGEAFDILVKFKLGTKRLLFTISQRVFGSNSILFQQIVFPENGQGGVAQFSVSSEITSSMSAGIYYWDVFQMKDDGSKDIWSPYNTGTFSIVEYPSSSSIVTSAT